MVLPRGRSWLRRGKQKHLLTIAIMELHRDEPLIADGQKFVVRVPPVGPSLRQDARQGSTQSTHGVLVLGRPETKQLSGTDGKATYDLYVSRYIHAQPAIG